MGVGRLAFKYLILKILGAVFCYITVFIIINIRTSVDSYKGQTIIKTIGKMIFKGDNFLSFIVYKSELFFSYIPKTNLDKQILIVKLLSL